MLCLLSRPGTGLRVLRFLLVLCGLCGTGQALAVCTTTGQYTVLVPLQPVTYSAGEDFPVGSNVRKQLVRGFNAVTVQCTKPGAHARMSLTGGSLYPGQSNIYQTGISGLGVRFKTPSENKYYPYDTTTMQTYGIDDWLAFNIELVKMGPLSAGSVNTALFPMVRIEAIDADNVLARVAWHTITGGFTLQTPTCTTPNFTWDLGTAYTGILKYQGNATPWVDTPVTLTGCQAFLGNNSNGSYTSYGIKGYNSGAVSEGGGGTGPNKLTMTLKPNTTAIDTSNGIVSLDSSATAAGFGVQVGSKQSGTYVPLSLAGEMVVTPAVGDNSGTVRFPLGARLIRTQTRVEGGSVSTSLTYTITYQ